MIPYDDLVTALASWRARQGLPVVQNAPVTPKTAPVVAAAPPAPAAVGPRTAPPGAPPRSAPQPVVQPSSYDFDDGEALIEDSPYDSDGEDFVVAFDQGSEQTAVGVAPPPENLLVPKRK